MGLEKEGSREELIDRIVNSTSYKSMLEHVFDQIRRLTVASLKEQYAEGLATDTTLSRKGGMGLAKFLSGKPGFEKETLQSLGLRTSFKFNQGDFVAMVDKKDVTEKVVQEMQKLLGNIDKKEIAFRIAALGEGIAKVKRGPEGQIQESVVEPGSYISNVFRGLQPMYKLKSSGGAELATSSYTKRSEAPNKYTPGGPALSYAEVLDYVIREKKGKGIPVEQMIGTFKGTEYQKPYEYISPAIKAYEEFERMYEKTKSVMTDDLYKVEGALSQAQTFGKSTVGVMGESSRAGKKFAYDKESQQIYIDSGVKSAFEDAVREVTLATTTPERWEAERNLKDTINRVNELITEAAARKYIDVGEGPKADKLRSAIEGVSSPSSRFNLKVDTLIEKMVYFKEYGPMIKDYLEKAGKEDILGGSRAEVIAALRRDPEFRKLAVEESAASYLAGGSGFGLRAGSLERAARPRDSFSLFGRSGIDLNKEIEQGLIGKTGPTDLRAFSLLFKDSWQDAAKTHAKELGAKEWRSIYKGHPLLRDMTEPGDSPYEDVIADLRKEGLYGGSKGVTHYINNIIKERMGQIMRHMGEKLPENWEELGTSQS